MKLVIDMAALSTDKRKMIVDYLQDNDVSITWAGHVNKIQDIARLSSLCATSKQFSHVALRGIAALDGIPTKIYRSGETEAEMKANGDTPNDYLLTASGEALDRLGELFGVERAPNQPCHYYRDRIWLVAKTQGTRMQWAHAERLRQQGLEVSVTRTKGEWPKIDVEGILADMEDARRTMMGPEYFRQQYMCTPVPGPHRPNEVAQLCHGTATKHRWAPTQFTHLSEARPILECVHCHVRIYGPYDALPLHLLNEDDPRLNMHHPD